MLVTIVIPERSIIETPGDWGTPLDRLSALLSAFVCAKSKAGGEDHGGAFGNDGR